MIKEFVASFFYALTLSSFSLPFTSSLFTYELDWLTFYQFLFARLAYYREMSFGIEFLSANRCFSCFYRTIIRVNLTFTFTEVASLHL